MPTIQPSLDLFESIEVGEEESGEDDQDSRRSESSEESEDQDSRNSKLDSEDCENSADKTYVYYRDNKYKW